MKTRLDAAAERIFKSHLGICFLCLLALFALELNVSGAAVDPGQVEQPPQLLNQPASSEPVILLTGFEPFGRGRLPNSCWEGIKKLDGQQWQGFRLVCKQVPVVWGAPLQQLQTWISQYQPAAVFSFGQGSPGSFALESKAANERGRWMAVPRSSTSTVALLANPFGHGPFLAASAIFPGRDASADNRGEFPPTPLIVAGGPGYFPASVDCRKIARVLQEKGYPVRVSRSAGRYLCEEALYSLEYLKATKQLEATVMFCHVPPLDTEVGNALRVLGTSIVGFMGPSSAQKPLLAASSLVCGKTLRGKPIAPERVQQFVTDTLETWRTIYQSETPISQVEQKKTPDAATSDRRQQEIKEFIGRYFRTWSTQDMKGYDGCFMPDAAIQYIDEDGQLATYGRRQFVSNQTEYHRKAAIRASEVPESIDIRFEAKLARVIVFWRLTAGPRNETGYDHFTLLKQDGNWRIVNLTFYPANKKIPD